MTEIADRYRRLSNPFRSPGVVGPEVPVPEGADVQTRALGFWGRAA